MRKNHYFLSCFLTIMALLFMIKPAFSANLDNIFSYKVGDVTISLLSEGKSEGNSSVLINASPEQMKKYIPTGNYPTSVNAFLVQAPNHTLLIDTGFGKKLFDNLKQLNILPEQIDSVLLTHMHADHIGGLLQNDKPTFPNAKLYVAKPEHDYWSSEAIMNSLPEKNQNGFKNAQRVLKAYGNRVNEFTPNPLGNKTALLPGVIAIEAFGHTPGHTAFLIQSNDKQILVWGDLAHAMAIQIPIPDVAVTYDVDPVTAVKTRKSILNYVTENKITIAGMHIAYPSIGQITQSPDGLYSYTPVQQ